MDVKITSTDLARSLSDVLNRVRYRGETFMIVRNGEVIASLGPKAPALGTSLSSITDALSELMLPGEGFADELEATQCSQSIVDVPAWPN